MLSVNDRIRELRRIMKAKKIDVYYIPNEDDHLSEEYTAGHFQCKSFISGFSGESGCVIITQKFAGLWTDGRYFTQAEKELAGSQIELMRMRQAGVPDPLDFMILRTPKGGVLGFDGRVVSAATAKKLETALLQKNSHIYMDEDLVSMVWKDRPSMPRNEIYTLSDKYTGETAKERIARVKAVMKERKADVLVLTSLEDPCWLFNVRGDDIPCTPVAYAFAMVTRTKTYYYIDLMKVPYTVKNYLKESGITIRPYTALGDDLATLKGKVIWADLNKLNAGLYMKLDAENTILNNPSPVLAFRAVKNETEIRNTYNAHVKDAVAVCRFIYWLKQNSGKSDLTEYSAQNVLYGFRSGQKDYIEPSFETICAYKGNAAMMHYTAREDNCAKIGTQGFLLVDSGGTYKDGTTDITRTIAMGEISAKEKKLYTLVLKGHLDLAAARFLSGTTGNNLDILARRPLWDLNIDYQCGTGHGVGHVLGVHEGPHGIRWGMPSASRPSAKLEEGMIVTDEPGIYVPDQIGIRIENELLVVKDAENFYGTWLRFDQMTFVPYEKDAIDVSMLDDNELKQLNDYHKLCWETVSPHLEGKEKAWLKKATARMTR